MGKYKKAGCARWLEKTVKLNEPQYSDNPKIPPPHSKNPHYYIFSNEKSKNQSINFKSCEKTSFFIASIPSGSKTYF